MMPWIIVAVYFVIGGAATFVVNKKKPQGARERWIKYAFYLLIVFATIGCIWFGQLFPLASIIVCLGLYEIVKVGNGTSLSMGLIVYFVVAFAFILFAVTVPIRMQLFTYVVVLTFDGFSQIAGQLFGKRKLVPKISPGKTIEGLAGGFVVAVATAFYIWDKPLTAAIICIAALAGDLLASYYKRISGVKDYSNLIPGHGGVLDRFDSLIFAGAFIWLST
jgi:phosphatidate cytidylyltransferase